MTLNHKVWWLRGEMRCSFKSSANFRASINYVYNLSTNRSNNIIISDWLEIVITRNYLLPSPVIMLWLSPSLSLAAVSTGHNVKRCQIGFCLQPPRCG